MIPELLSLPKSLSDNKKLGTRNEEEGMIDEWFYLYLLFVSLEYSLRIATLGPAMSASGM